MPASSSSSSSSSSSTSTSEDRHVVYTPLLSSAASPLVAANQESQTRIFVSLESDQSSRYWIPISAIPTWQEFVAILASIFHNDSPPILYYVSDRRNIIHESVWPYREYLTQNGIFHVEFERPNETRQNEHRGREVVVAVQGRVEAPGGVVEGTVLDDSGNQISLPPPPPYSRLNDVSQRNAENAGISSPNEADNNLLSPQDVASARTMAYSLLSPYLPFSSIFSLHLLFKTLHNPNSSSTIPNFTLSQHLIVDPSVAISHIREIAKRLYLMKYPSQTDNSQTTITLEHKKFCPGRHHCPIRFDEMFDGKNLGDYGCIDEDSIVEVTVRLEQNAPSPTLSERAAVWIREIRDVNINVERQIGTENTDGRLEELDGDLMDLDGPEGIAENVQ